MEIPKKKEIVGGSGRFNICIALGEKRFKLVKKHKTILWSVFVRQQIDEALKQLGEKVDW